MVSMTNSCCLLCLKVPAVSGTLQTWRCLNLHEYQSKELMSKYNIGVQKFIIAETAEDAGSAAKKLG